MGIMFWKRQQERPRVQAYAAISQEELQARLLAAADSPVFAAVLVVVDEEIVRLADAAREEGLAEPKLRHRLGGVDALQGLKDVLEQRIQEAREAEVAKEKEKER